MAKYTIGIDFGTLSARALVAEVSTGREMGSSEFAYRHAVMTEALPDGTPLGPDWALQHPADYLEALDYVIPKAMEISDVSKDDVIGIGVDFTSSTMIPLDAYFEPMCAMYPDRPHAYVKLWKHHATMRQADRMTKMCTRRMDAFLKKYGGKVSPEWLIPKVLQHLEEDQELYDAATHLAEAGDWIVYKLTGRYVKSSAMAGYKAFWSKKDGYPAAELMKSLHPKLENVFENKLYADILPPGRRAGGLTREMAERLGLNEGTAVSVSQIDAHVSLPPSGVTESGQMCMIMGTSTCHIVLGDTEKIVPGMCGVVEDAIIEGLLGFEAGQSCVGDSFHWFAEKCVPEAYKKKACEQGLDVHQYLTSLAQKKKPGETGLIALDWWNGNRSTLVDMDLTGMLIGMTLETKPEEIYRALVESTAFGTRMIIDTFSENGVPVRSITACGGIAQKNPFIMQVYADVLRREIRVARSAQTPALGSCMLGAVAAGREKGGYDTIRQASAAMGGTMEKSYRPMPANSAVYDKLYYEYRRLYDYFGKGGNEIMKRLKSIRRDQAGGGV